jgi:transcriptional regulator with XRE-family HTH domain
VPSRSSLQAELRTLGANIRRERTARGITQEKLAEKADLNLRTVQKIEAGDINILVTTLVRIHQALKCGWDKLLPL